MKFFKAFFAQKKYLTKSEYNSVKRTVALYKSMSKRDRDIFRFMLDAFREGLKEEKFIDKVKLQRIIRLLSFIENRLYIH